MNLTLYFDQNFKDTSLAGQHKLLHPNTGKTYKIGRKPECDIRVAYIKASRIHATFKWDEDAGIWFVIDGGYYEGKEYHPSSNGVWLNNRRVDPITDGDGREIPNPEPLKYEDDIRLGGVGVMTVVYDQHATLKNEAEADEQDKQETIPPVMEIVCRNSTAPEAEEIPEVSWASLARDIATKPMGIGDLAWKLFLVALGLLLAIVVLPILL